MTMKLAVVLTCSVQIALMFFCGVISLNSKLLHIILITFMFTLSEFILVPVIMQLILCFATDNPCYNVRCENGGRCLPLPGGKFKCHCIFGYSGKRCQIGIVIIILSD